MEEDVEVSLPVLLRHARTTYAAAMRSALADAGYDDIPKNGLYVIGGLAWRQEGSPLGELIRELGLSKQAAGQLVDALVTRGYLERKVDPADRRKLTVELSERGHAAAAVQAVARAAVDAELLVRVGAQDVDRARRALFALIEIGRESRAAALAVPRSGTGVQPTMQLHDVRKTLDVKNADLSESRFSDVKLAAVRFEDVNLRAAGFLNVNLGDATFKDVDMRNVCIEKARLSGMRIDGVLVTDLILAYKNRTA